MSESGIQKNRRELFFLLQKAVFSGRPVLPSIMERFGEMTILDYITDAVTHAGDNIPAERKAPLLAALRSEAGRLYGDAVAERAARQVEKYYAVSTADHHGPIAHSSFTSADMALALPSIRLPDYTDAIILTGSMVSMSNPSFPGGLLLSTHGEKNAIRLPFFSSRKRDMPVLGCKAYGEMELNRLFAHTNELSLQGRITPDVAQKACDTIRRTYASESVMNATLFDDQVSIANRSFFDAILPDKTAGQPGLIYLSLERVLKRVLLDYHLQQPTLINRILFDRETRQKATDILDGTFGGFSLAEKKGTFFFWGTFGVKGERVALWEDNGHLKSDNGAVDIALEPVAVSAAVERGTLVPSTMLALMIWVLYHGLACFGGTAQINYLTDLRKRYLKLLDEIPDSSKDDHEVANAVAPDWLIPYRLAFIADDAGRYRPANGLDLAVYGHTDVWQATCETASKLTLGEAISAFLPELYSAIHHGAWSEAKDVPIGLADVIDLLDIAKHISPVGAMKKVTA